VELLHNHVGYSVAGSKLALVQTDGVFDGTDGVFDGGTFTVYAADTRKLVFTGELRPRGGVMQWRGWRYWEADFSALTESGRYFVEVDGIAPPVVSAPFEVATDIFDLEVLSDLLHYFKSQRSSGVFDLADRQCQIFGSSARVDVHGGWGDASGDNSKYLSHLSYANFMNPQQIPQVVWNLIEGRSRLADTGLWMDDRMVDEALHGADFLVRMQSPEGYFYITVFDQWSKDVDKRMVCSFTTQAGHRFDTYQAGYRQGGGSTIAALARASRLPRDGEHTRAQYLGAAERGFAHLEEHNTEYLDDGVENIIDDYCALLAAVELFAATGADAYYNAAQLRADRLIARQHADGWFWADDAKTRSYIHAAEAGMPYAVLLRFLEVVADSPGSGQAVAVAEAVRRGLRHEIDMTTGAGDNPFHYPRQFVVLPGKPGRVQYFIPHENESGYWWQGENARLASLACAAQWGARHWADDELFSADLRRYAQGSLDWIFGLNPFDACMMQGHGHNNPQYEPGAWNAPGGVCNGITSGELNEADIDFKSPCESDPMQSWRWSEQWLPHGAWLFVALAHKLGRAS
jgi:hypothetical protein